MSVSILMGRRTFLIVVHDLFDLCSSLYGWLKTPFFCQMRDVCSLHSKQSQAGYLGPLSDNFSQSWMPFRVLSRRVHDQSSSDCSIDNKMKRVKGRSRRES